MVTVTIPATCRLIIAEVVEIQDASFSLLLFNWHSINLLSCCPSQYQLRMDRMFSMWIQNCTPQRPDKNHRKCKLSFNPRLSFWAPIIILKSRTGHIQFMLSAITRAVNNIMQPRRVILPHRHPRPTATQTVIPTLCLSTTLFWESLNRVDRRKQFHQ